MSEVYNAERQIQQKIEEAELRLHRLMVSRDRAPDDEKDVVNDEIREIEKEIRHLKAQLPT